MPIKIAGKEVPAALNEDVLVLPRGDEAIVIRARALVDIDEFAKLCPDPKPPGKLTKDGWEPNLNDDTYKKRVEQHNRQRAAYMVLHSLAPTEIEWETVDIDNPKTWVKWEDELKESGFTNVECNLILQLVMDVNSLNDAKLKAAKDSFLLGLAQVSSEQSSQTSEQSDTPSGEHVSDSE